MQQSIPTSSEPYKMGGNIRENQLVKHGMDKLYSERDKTGDVTFIVLFLKFDLIRLLSMNSPLVIVRIFGALFTGRVQRNIFNIEKTQRLQVAAI